jgi:hypothetical protein
MVVILTGDEILAKGLKLVGFDRPRQCVAVEQNVA